MENRGRKRTDNKGIFQRQWSIFVRVEGTYEPMESTVIILSILSIYCKTTWKAMVDRSGTWTPVLPLP